MGAEDFSYVIERVPGMMAFLGARPASEDPATAPQNHSNLVVFDEAPMALGVALYAAAALDFLATASAASRRSRPVEVLLVVVDGDAAAGPRRRRRPYASWIPARSQPSASSRTTRR